MGHRNLGLYSITYEKAEEMLSRMKKSERWIANNTILYRSFDVHRDVDYPCYCIQLHSTPIITFFRDGAIRISCNGWEDHPTTRDRLRCYLPGNMTIDWGGLRIITRPHFLIINNGERTVARPLGTNRVFRSDGTAEDLEEMNDRDAKEVWEQFLLYEKKFLVELMGGRLERPKTHLKVTTGYALRLLDTMEIDVRVITDNSNWFDMFFKDNYRRFAPTSSRVLKADLADWMERHLRGDRMRPPRGTKEYREIKTLAAQRLRDYFLEALRFDD